MDRPGQSGEGRDPAAARGCHPAGEEKLPGKEEECDSRSRVEEDVGDVIGRWREGEGGVFEGVSQALYRPVKIRGGRVDKKEVIKSFRDKPPTADQRIAQDERGVVPDKAVSDGWRVRGQHGDKDGQNNERFLHGENGLDRIKTLGV